ncbi:MAG: hypothetical protein QQW96_17450 [Tychonema bourrellyi B0820]|nr:hypothetical protein [Tychonema bourrellyi B0820]
MLLISSTSAAISWASTSKRGLQSLSQAVRGSGNWELGMGHGAWGMGHGAWGIRHWALI